MPSCRTLFLSTAGLVLLLVAAAPQGGSAADWPQHLGPRRDGISTEKALRFDWKENKPRELWKIPLGSGYGSPVIVGERLFVMARKGDRDFIYCLAADSGKEVWKHDAVATFRDEQGQCSGPRSTPTYHDGKLYCLMSRGELLCLDAKEGKEHWRKNTFTETGAAEPDGRFWWGVSVSPLVEGDLVIVQPGGKKGNSVAAFHKDTGKLAWTSGDDPPGYASPIAVAIGRRRQLIVPTGQSILGLDPEKGTILWRYGFGNRFNATCATPVWADGLLFVSAAYGTGSAALELVEKDGKWKAVEKWTQREMQNLFATSLAIDGKLYGCSGDLGAIFIRCLELQSGKILWEERSLDRVTMLAADGHLLALGERGGLKLLEINPKKYVLKAELADVMAYKAWAVPVIAHGRLYIRDEKSLLCWDLRPK